MEKIRFTFLAYNNSLIFEIKGNNESIKQFFHYFTSMFPNLVIGNTVHPNFKNTKELSDQVIAFVNIYQSKVPKLNTITAFFRKLKEGEEFFIYPVLEVPQKLYIEVNNYLMALAEGKDFEQISIQMNELFDDLMNDYDLIGFGDTRLSIGEADKKKRICRFCNNTRQNLSFKNRAHAISEALGNKTLTLYDECDGCNTEFSQTIEPEIIEYFSFLRTIFRIKGKGGEKQFKGENFELKKEDDNDLKSEKTEEPKLILQFFQDENTELGPDLPFRIMLKAKNKIVLQNIYKCLCKYFLSVIDKKHLPAFKETIEWVNGKKIYEDQLPVIAKFSFPNLFQEQPQIVVYIRKNNNKSLPFAVGEFHFAFLKYIFILPFSSEDDLDYSVKENYDMFWNKFVHFNKIPHSSFDDFSDNKEKNFIISFRIEKKDNGDDKLDSKM